MKVNLEDLIGSVKKQAASSIFEDLHDIIMEVDEDFLNKDYDNITEEQKDVIVKQLLNYQLQLTEIIRNKSHIDIPTFKFEGIEVEIPNSNIIKDKH